MKHFIQLSLVFVLLILGGRTSAEETAAWKTVSVSTFFTMMLPETMSKKEVQGIDSYVEAYTGPNMKLSLDWGIWSDPLKYKGQPQYQEKQVTIDGVQAKMINMYYPETSHAFKYIVAAHFPRVPGGALLTLWINCKSQKDFPHAEKILRSIHFLAKTTKS